MNSAAKFAWGLAALASAGSAQAQSNLASSQNATHVQRANVGIIIPFGRSGSPSETAPRIEAWTDRARQDAGSRIRIADSGNRPAIKPLRFGLSLENQPRALVNGRVVMQPGNRHGVSTVGWVGIGVGVVVIIGALAVSGAFGQIVPD